MEVFRSLASHTAAAARARDGRVFLDAAEEIGDPTTFRLVEGWRDQGAFDAHNASYEFQAVLKDAATLSAVDRCADINWVLGKSTRDVPS